MRLTKRARFWLRVGTWWLPAYCVLFVAYSLKAWALASHGSEPPALARWGMWTLHMVAVLSTCGLGLFYLYFLFRSGRVEMELKQKARWAAALLLGFPVAMPLFLYRYVLPYRPEAAVQVEFNDDEEEADEVIDIE